MAQAMDYVEYLSREIGARPAGTEEEEQAALYIADEFQKETGFPATIEEFTSSANLEGGRAILSMVTIVASVLAMLFNVLTGPMFILALIAAVIYVMESYGKPVFSNRLARVPSQNVVAKYQPAEQPEAGKRPQRKRKIVLVAHYDTGKVTPKIVDRVESMGLPLPKICLWGMVAAAFFLLLRIFLGGTGGVGLIFINILTIIAIVIVALPIVKAVLYRSAAYNEGANNNATGVAALLEVAKRISSGSLSEADLIAEHEAMVHGAEAAIEQGLVPEGAQLIYEVQPGIEDDETEYSEEERLLAAKAAIAALTGQPVEQRVYGNVSSERPAKREETPAIASQVVEEAVQVADDVATSYAEVAAASLAAVAAAEPEPEEEISTGFENAPSWFVAAQRNAKRSEEPAQVQRSRYTEAIQAAERELAERDRAREEEERLMREQLQRERDAATRAALAAMRGEEQPVVQQHAEELEIAEERTDWAYEEQPAFEPTPVAFAVPEIEIEPAVEDQPEIAFEPVAEPEPEPAIDVELEPVAEEAEDEQVDFQAEAEPAEEVFEELDEGFEAELEEPGEFEDRVQDEVVDLGQTIAYTPEMIREAIREEMAQQQAVVASAALDQAEEMDEIIAEKQVAVQARAREQLASLPSFEEPAKPAAPENDNPSRSGLFRMLRADVPSISGSIAPVQPQPEPAKATLESGAIPRITLDEEKPEQIDYGMTLPISDEDEQERTWEGGAFSRLRLGHVNTRSGEDETADEPEELAEAIEDQQLSEEIEQIYHFRNPDFDTEVWFVAIGSDDEYHDGAKAFLAEHKADLRGAMVVELESLGVGELCVASEEGSFRKLQASSRIKRFTRGATEATGLVLGQIKTQTDSITTVLQSGGVQAMHIMGVEDGRPSLKGSADDIVENVDEMLLEENIDYIAELLKQD